MAVLGNRWESFELSLIKVRCIWVQTVRNSPIPIPNFMNLPGKSCTHHLAKISSEVLINLHMNWILRSPRRVTLAWWKVTVKEGRHRSQGGPCILRRASFDLRVNDIFELGLHFYRLMRSHGVWRRRSYSPSIHYAHSQRSPTALNSQVSGCARL